MAVVKAKKIKETVATPVCGTCGTKMSKRTQRFGGPSWKKNCNC